MRRPATAELEIEPRTENIARARRFVQSTLRGWGFAYSGEVPLLTSEAVTNAIVHTGTSAVVRVTVEDGTIRVAVRDRSAGQPAVQDPAAEDPSGRGMLLIQQLAADWGVEHAEDGKTVWFTTPVR